ncbi:unnamed protein product, partial [Ixodes hexagonus]
PALYIEPFCTSVARTRVRTIVPSSPICRPGERRAPVSAPVNLQVRLLITDTRPNERPLGFYRVRAPPLMAGAH